MSSNISQVLNRVQTQGPFGDKAGVGRGYFLHLRLNNMIEKIIQEQDPMMRTNQSVVVLAGLNLKSPDPLS